MAAVDRQPENQNFLSPLGFRFTIQKTPHINWFVQAANIPGMALPAVEINTPFKTIPLSGEHLQYEPFVISFRVDEEMKNYVEIYDWLIGSGFPDNYGQYFGRGPDDLGVKSFTKQDAVKSDASLTILNSNMRPIIDVKFVDIAPIALSELNFDMKYTDVDYIAAQATFSYRYFLIERLQS